MDGTTWDVDSVVGVIDGDSIRVVRSRPFPIDGRKYRLSDDSPKGILCRLVWVDTPERGDPEWATARRDLDHWVTTAAYTSEQFDGLRVVCYESAGWDRILVDLLDADGNSASQYLLADRGWPYYVRG